MSPLKQPIGILGGTFDPVHRGHIQIAQSVRQALDLSEVRLIPCYQPIHRELPIATPEQRIAMLQLAIVNEPFLTVDDCEIQRKGLSYMVDTLEILQQRFPQTPLCLIMGIDAFIGLPSWHRYNDILQLAHLIILQRPHYQLPKMGIIPELLKQYLTHDIKALHQAMAGFIFYYSLPLIDISATAIREKIATGQNPDSLLPIEVYNYILEQGLYQATLGK
jgi:nicotinate-nucleotide adenylyltransferase